MEILLQQHSKESLNPVNFHNLYLKIHDAYSKGILEVNDNSYIEGEVDVQYAYRDAITFLENLYLDPNKEEPFNKRLIINMPDSNEYFKFADENTQLAVGMTWGGQNPGLTERQIRNVTFWPNGNTLNGLNYWKDAEYFNEFSMFVNLTTPTKNELFRGMPKLKEIDCSHLTKLTDRFFYQSKLLYKVGATINNELPNLINIGYDVFSHTAIETISIPNLVETTLQSNFYNCLSLKTINIDGPNLNTIDNYCFYYDNELTSITGLSHITKIGNQTFRHCTKLSHVDNIDKITYFGEMCFYECTLLDPDISSAEYIYGNAFSYSGITNANLQNIVYLTNGLQNCKSLRNVTFGDNYIDYSIVRAAFYEDIALETINLDNCKIIESEAFRGCTALRTIGNTSNLLRFDGDGGHFRGCTSLESINLSNIKNIPTLCFYQCGVKTLGDTSLIERIGSESFKLSGLTGSFLFPSLQILNNQAFRECKNITALDLGSTITYINGTSPSENWRDCTALQSFTATSLQTLYNYDFLNDNHLTTVNLPEVTLCGNYVFKNCTALTNISLPKLVSCGYQCFQNTGIEHLSFPLLETIGEECSANTSKLLSINLPSAKIINIKAFYNCNNLEEVHDMPLLETIGNSAFDYDKNIIGTINIPNVTSIGTWAFSQCENVEHITLGNGITRINAGTFYHCYNLRELNTTNWVTIDRSALCGCTSITELNLSNLKYLVNSSNDPGSHFSSMSQLTTVTSLQNLETMEGSGIFASCINLVTAPVSNKLKVIPQTAFYDCRKLENIGDISGVTSIGTQAFWYTTSLNYSGDLSSVTYIANYAFAVSNIGPNLNAPLWNSINTTNTEGRCFISCHNLKTVNIPSLNIIPESCFNNCDNLESITFSQNLTTIKAGAFQECKKLNNIDLPSTITELQNQCFGFCYALTTLTCRATTPPTTASNIFYATNNIQHIYVPAESVDDYKAATGWSDKSALIEAIPS